MRGAPGFHRNFDQAAVACRSYPKEPVMTPLDKPLRRALEIGDRSYTLLVDASGLKLTEKGRRKGIELKWTDLVSGDAALAVALQASVDAK
jgi:hypothetical protein